MRDVPSRPIYGVGERSGIRIRRVAPRIAWLLFKGFWWRMKEKYVIRDFHPLVFFYVLGIADDRASASLLGLVVAASRIFWGNEITTATIVLVALLLDLGHAVHAVRDVVRPGGEQGAALRPVTTGFRGPQRHRP